MAIKRLQTNGPDAIAEAIGDPDFKIGCFGTRNSPDVPLRLVVRDDASGNVSILTLPTRQHAEEVISLIRRAISKTYGGEDDDA